MKLELGGWKNDIGFFTHKTHPNRQQFANLLQRLCGGFGVKKGAQKCAPNTFQTM